MTYCTAIQVMVWKKRSGTYHIVNKFCLFFACIYDFIIVLCSVFNEILLYIVHKVFMLTFAIFMWFNF